MPADRLLETLLRSLQTWTDQQDTPRLLGTAASLLTTLTNPLNIQLLVSQLLSAPAIWERPDGLRTCQRVMGLFHSAALTVLQHERDVREGTAKPPLPGQMPVGGGMPTEDWVTAVVRGADERSPRWKHLLVLGGLLLGSGADVDCRLAGSLEAKLQDALVQATNLALLDVRDGDELGAHCIALVLNHVFPVLSEAERAQVDYDHLLPVLIGAAFFSNEGFQSAYFLGTVDLDVVEEAGQMLNWSIQDMDLKGMVRRRFWEVLVGGEMDPERSMVAVSWWSTRGGREKVMFGDDGSGNGEAPLGNEEEGRDKYLMSGALPASGVMEEVEEGKPRESKL
ncbi:Peroxisomal membrane protein pex17 [Neofusicoccum parvum]|uniref:Peroxisomal membrane protein pex17 n=1 Tax=Neofusicoccum parvum TaxID=310453 RepID=A0ACB5SHK1_9PEZI|nr:Peroxisomal membrane protein pex17 [Neofusicoccum parvum]GME64253.1 Peroxisomal membrane protein pex17 [Neofusicoccum parvum]